jgi:hypothetical protein
LYRHTVFLKKKLYYYQVDVCLAACTARAFLAVVPQVGREAHTYRDVHTEPRRKDGCSAVLELHFAHKYPAESAVLFLAYRRGHGLPGENRQAAAELLLWCHRFAPVQGHKWHRVVRICRAYKLGRAGVVRISF